MSNKAAVVSLVQNKMQAARHRINQETQGIGDTLEQAKAKSQMLGDYQLYFQGANELGSALGLSEDDLRPVALAARAIQADIEAEENRALLEQELRRDLGE